jgi:hypothetical protein
MADRHDDKTPPAGSAEQAPRRPGSKAPTTPRLGRLALKPAKGVAPSSNVDNNTGTPGKARPSPNVDTDRGPQAGHRPASPNVDNDRGPRARHRAIP